MVHTLVGRDAELASVVGFIDEVPDAASALVLEGETGIGKSALWLAGVQHARTRMLCTLASRPAEAEHGLAYAGLGDLLEPVLDTVLPRLSRPRRHALEIATLREEALDDPVDQRAVAVAVRDVLQIVSEKQPVLVAIDDVQWLDPTSSRVLAFALRRLSGNGVLVLLTRRLGDAKQSRGFDSAMAADRVRTLTVGPLSVGALHHLLRDRVGRPFARQTLLRIHERSGGNPFFALELARVLPDIEPFEPLPVPGTLEELLRARIAVLPPRTCEALAFIAALGQSTESILVRAGLSLDDLAPATAAHVIERQEGVVRFTHPLLSSVLYGDLGDGRASVHARIAENVDDPMLRARHLALATLEPDAGVANSLDSAVSLAEDRGASAVAAELAEYAVRLTPADATDERRRRALDAARAHQLAGEWTRARRIARELLSEAPAGTWRGEALVLLSELEGVDRATELLEQALQEAASRPALRALIHCRLAWVTRFRVTFDHAGAALQLADELNDDELRERARAVKAILSWFAGTEKEPEDLLALARHLPDAVGGDRLVQEATQAIVNTYASSARRTEARTFLETEHLAWRDRDEPRSARALWGLAWIEFWAGNWVLAAENARRAFDVAIQYGLEVPQDHLPIAVIAAHRGQLDVARQHSERALRLALEQFGFQPPQHMAVLALVSLESGDAFAALGWFEQAQIRADALGWREPSLRWWTGDHIELLLERGRSDEALTLLDAWQADAARVERVWVGAHATRCRGLVAAGSGNIDAALVLLTRAVEEHDAVGDPFGRARALLALGVAKRRARQKRPAREAIEASLAAFETIGATRWVARASSELGRISGRQAAAGLSAAERRVADLVVQGRTNHEVATALFLGERTVASHLTSVYAKLGVRSRTELARRLDARHPD